MSKADQLGSSSAFGAASAPRSSRRDTIDSAIRGGGTEEAAITDLPVTLISDNPDNPRNHLRSLEETVDSVREVGVILPIVVATTEAYLHERPERSEDLDLGAQYIVVDGHRRLEAARRVGLATIPVRVDNARVSSDEALLEAAFVANYHRDDMTDLEEAQALKSLVDYYKSQTKASKRLGIPQNTISTKLSLLKLSPELQKDLVTGTRTVEHVRNLGKLSPEEQKVKADERAAAARRKAEKTQSPHKVANAEAPTEGASRKPSPPEVPAQVSRRDNSEEKSGEAVGPASSRLEGSPAEEEVGQPDLHDQTAEQNEDTRGFWESVESLDADWLPLHKPDVLARMLQERMSPSNFEQMVKVAQTLL